jgi:flagellar export protein FliJ
MSFHSPLLPLFRLRTSLERMAWLRLRTTHSQISSATTRLRQLEQEGQDVLRGNVEKLKAGTTSEVLRLESVTALEAEAKRVAQLLEGLGQQRRVAEKAFMNCRRDREIVENAITLEREAYEIERAKRDQALTDDMTLQRMTRIRANGSTD